MFLNAGGPDALIALSDPKLLSKSMGRYFVTNRSVYFDWPVMVAAPINGFDNIDLL
jgi:hypothetical protein